jgi:uncharacterized protein (PEP-CTERM system associated)
MVMKGLYPFIVALLAASAVCGGAASAQESNLAPAASSAAAPAGWSVTPSMTYSAGWDDNVLVRGQGDNAAGDVVNVINPRGALNLNGRKGQFSLNYDGAFVAYRDLNTLNSYDQHASLAARRLLSPHVALFVTNAAASVPTTEMSQFIGVPFVRTGSRLDDFRAGIEAALTKHTSIIASYDFQWVQFDHSLPESAALHGGHSHGGTLALKHQVSERFSLTADYDLQHATIDEDAQIFDVQNAWAGGEYRLTEFTRVFAGAGYSRLGATAINGASTGPAWRLGLSRTFRKAGVDLLYSRSLVPSYGFGGTMQNVEATLRANAPLGRRVYASPALTWRRNDPLTPGLLPLRSYWLEATVGYAATPWVHVELFYEGTHQNIDRPGGIVDRNRIGVQITTAKPVRIQ